MPDVRRKRRGEGVRKKRKKKKENEENKKNLMNIEIGIR